jgi:hypothetical protein
VLIYVTFLSDAVEVPQVGTAYDQRQLEFPPNDN